MTLEKYLENDSFENKIDNLQKKYQLTLPTSYIQFLQAGKTQKYNESCFDFWYEDILDYAQRDIYFLDFNNDEYDITEHDTDTAIPKHQFIIGESAGGDIIVLDFSQINQSSNTNNPKKTKSLSTLEPTISLILHDECLINEKLPKHTIANSFDEFINQLYQYETVYDETKDRPKSTQVYYQNLEIQRDLGSLLPDDFQEFYSKFKVVLPKTYVNFISQHNEADIINSNIEFMDFYQKDRCENCRFLGFSQANRHILHPYCLQVSNHKMFGHQGLIAFAKAHTKDLWCFQYSENSSLSEPNIVFIDMDIFEQDENGRSCFVISNVADSFDDFISQFIY